MTERVIGPTGSKRRRRFLLAPILVAVLTALVFTAGGQALPTGLFELDKNAADDAAAGIDWNNVYNATRDAEGRCTNPAALGAAACSFVSDLDGHSIFTTGGSKDDLDVPSWRHKDGNVPPKDEITNAYAAKFVAPNGHEILYFGADRFAQNGSADFGFWFFRNEISMNADGTFSGVHTGSLTTPGDILILGTFTQGGATSNIRVFKWVGTGGNATSNGTVEGPTGAFGECVGAPANAAGCGTVNDALIPVAWPYTPSQGAAGSIPIGGFVEGGIDLSDPSLNLAGCFRSFLAETRSSPSVDSTLKDFVLGNFEACDSTLTTTPTQAAGVSIGSGVVGVTDSATLVVNGSSTWNGTLEFFLCGPIAAPATCDTGGVSAGAAVAVNNTTTQPFVSPSLNVTSAGRYCWRGVFASLTTGVPGDTDSSTGECFVVSPVTPTLNTIAVLNAAGDPIPAGYKFPFGSAVYDTATLGNAATEPGTNGGNATYPSIGATNGAYAGTIEFALKGPDGGTPACSITNATGTGTNPQTVNVDTVTGNKTYGPVGYTPGTPGAYHWVAIYTNAGSLNNNSPVSHNADCSDPDEAVTVEQIPTAMTTRQFVVPQDKVTITVGAGGGDLAGSVRFTLHDSLAECEARTDIKYDSGGIAIAGTSPQSATTSNTYRILDGTTHYWNVSYTSTNLAHVGSSSVCSERTTVTYAGNDGTIAIP